MSNINIEQISGLHMECLPTSMLTQLGAGATSAYYRFVDASAKERIFYETQGVKTTAVCVLSLSPQNLNSRFLIANLSALIWPLSKYYLCNLSKVIGTLFSSEREPSIIGGGSSPEVVQIFTAKELRGKGWGGKLLARVEKYLKDEGHKTYFLKTENRPDNQAIGFYLRQGFSEIVSSQKNEFKYFIKSL